MEPEKRKAKRQVGKVTTSCDTLLRTKRKSGNTTRQADWAINMIFKGFQVRIKDHSLLTRESEHLFAIVVSRLENEHNLEQLLEKDLISVNAKTLTIKLCSKK
jgi:hypothetical protein